MALQRMENLRRISPGCNSRGIEPYDPKTPFPHVHMPKALKTASPGSCNGWNRGDESLGVQAEQESTQVGARGDNSYKRKSAEMISGARIRSAASVVRGR